MEVRDRERRRARKTGREAERGASFVRSTAARSRFALQRACRQKRCKRTYPSSGYLRRGVNANARSLAVAIRHDRCVADCSLEHRVLTRDVGTLRSFDGPRSRTRRPPHAAPSTLGIAPLRPRARGSLEDDHGEHHHVALLLRAHREISSRDQPGATSDSRAAASRGVPPTAEVHRRRDHATKLHRDHATKLRCRHSAVARTLDARDEVSVCAPPAVSSPLVYERCRARPFDAARAPPFVGSALVRDTLLPAMGWNGASAGVRSIRAGSVHLRAMERAAADRMISLARDGPCFWPPGLPSQRRGATGRVRTRPN